MAGSGMGCAAARALYPTVAVSFDQVMYFYDGCKLSNAADWIPYANDPAASGWDDPRRVHELFNYFVSFITLAHAIRSGGLRYWLGFLAFGLFMEVVGIFSRSHAHGQYLLQLTYFCPLKEALWYAMTMYNSLFVAQQLNLSPVSEAALVALLQMLVNIPYEAIGKRPGIHLLTYNKNFLLADVANEFMGAPVINVLANFVMPFYIALVPAYFVRKYKVDFFPSMVGIGLSAPVSAPMFAPISMLKSAGCVHIPLPTDLLSTKIFNPDKLAQIAQWYTRCMMKESLVTETSILSLFLTLGICLVTYELLTKPRAASIYVSNSLMSPESLGLTPLIAVLIQLFEYSFIVLRYDESGNETVVSTLMMIFNIGVVSVFFFLFVNSKVLERSRILATKKFR